VKFATFAICAIVLLTGMSAEAQIYSWRDASGTLVLSNTPRSDGGSEMATHAVRETSQLRTTTQPTVSPDQTRFDSLIEQYAASLGVSADLIRAVIQAESGFNPRAVSPKGALGLMQLMPATARELGVDDPFHPADNIRGGVTYLARLLARYHQNVELALAAYNAGPASVERSGNAIPPFRETRDYVKKITARSGVAAAPAPPPLIYKWTDIVDGQPKVRYSNVAPTGVAYETVGRR
jgi:soluble lytic murein transglycosylase-like protein